MTSFPSPKSFPFPVSSNGSDASLLKDSQHAQQTDKAPHHGQDGTTHEQRGRVDGGILHIHRIDDHCDQNEQTCGK